MSEMKENGAQDSSTVAAPQDDSLPEGRAPPAALNVSKLRSKKNNDKSSNDVAMSPTTSVKALLADTGAAPPAPSQATLSSNKPNFEDQQASLRRRNVAATQSESSSCTKGTAAVGLELGNNDDTLLQDDMQSKPPAPLIDGRTKPGLSASVPDARPTFNQTLQDLRQFLLHFLKVLPFKGLQTMLKKIIGPIVRLIVKGVAHILHKHDFGLASNLAFDIHLLLWKVSQPTSLCISWDSTPIMLIWFNATRAIVDHQSFL
jgi:hypothetical protein